MQDILPKHTCAGKWDGTEVVIEDIDVPVWHDLPEGGVWNNEMLAFKDIAVKLNLNMMIQ